MKNHKVYLKTFVPGEGKDEQDEGMIYLTTSMTEKNRRQNNVTALRQEIKGFIKCLIDAVLSFYLIRLRPNDLKRDLVENIITNMILKDEIYTIIFRLYSELYEEDIHCLRRLQDNQVLLQQKLSLDSEALKINKEFQMSLEVRS
jgi:hypothetical protein